MIGPVSNKFVLQSTKRLCKKVIEIIIYKSFPFLTCCYLGPLSINSNMKIALATPCSETLEL
jgi:hypothetical protein